jgi:hypothetical protein
VKRVIGWSWAAFYLAMVYFATQSLAVAWFVTIFCGLELAGFMIMYSKRTVIERSGYGVPALLAVPAVFGLSIYCVSHGGVAALAGIVVALVQAVELFVTGVVPYPKERTEP